MSMSRSRRSGRPLLLLAIIILIPGPVAQAQTAPTGLQAFAQVSWTPTGEHFDTTVAAPIEDEPGTDCGSGWFFPLPRGVRFQKDFNSDPGLIKTEMDEIRRACGIARLTSPTIDPTWGELSYAFTLFAEWERPLNGTDVPFTLRFDLHDASDDPVIFESMELTDSLAPGEPVEVSLPFPVFARSTKTVFKWEITEKPIEEGGPPRNFQLEIRDVRMDSSDFGLPVALTEVGGGTVKDRAMETIRAVDLDLPSSLFQPETPVRVDLEVPWPSGEFRHFVTSDREEVLRGVLVDPEARTAQVDTENATWLAPGRISLVHAEWLPLQTSILLTAFWSGLATVGVVTVGGSAYGIRRVRSHRMLLSSAWGVASGAVIAVLAYGIGRDLPFLVRVWPPLPQAVVALAVSILLIFAFVAIWSTAQRLRARSLAAERDAEANLHARLREHQGDLETLVYGASHDLQTPVVALRWMLEDLDSDMSTGQRDDVQETLRRMRGSLEGVEGLVGSLLEYARAGSGEEAAEDVDLHGLVERIFDEVTAREGRPGVRLETEGLGVVRAQPVRVRQILQNLVSNAVRYGRDDGTVRVSADTADGTLRLWVDDDGPGIPAEERTAVFELFRRGGAGHERPGSGIGLATVQRYVRSLDGTIVADTSPLGGARFEIKIPVEG